MKVSQLIKQLQKLNPNEQIVFAPKIEDKTPVYYIEGVIEAILYECLDQPHIITISNSGDIAIGDNTTKVVGVLY